MQIRHIDKARYRHHLNRVIWGAIALLVFLSLSSSTLLIYTLGEPGGSNFGLNVTGVIIAVVVNLILLNKCRRYPYFEEIDYVLLLKHELNLIHRKFAKVKSAANKNDIDALIVMNFHLRGSKQLFTLDDNDLTMSKLDKDILEFEAALRDVNVEVRTEDYRREMLNKIAAQ